MFLVELIASSFLDLISCVISKQARLNAAVRAFLVKLEYLLLQKWKTCPKVFPSVV